MAQWVTGKIVEFNWWTPSLFSIKVAADVKPFIAGQFTKLALNIDGKRVARAYSFVNAPQDPLLEFYLIEVPDGRLSSHLATLDIGDSVDVEADAHGFFTLNEVPKADVLWMFSTGTAIGPFLSILAEGKIWGQFERVILVHGVRYNTDLTYQDSIHATAALFKQFTYIPLVTREDPEHGLRGRVTELIDSGSLQAHCKMTQFPDNSHFMICGNPEMVKDTTQLLLAQGFTRHRRVGSGHITVEQYW
ncbi:ferredoxin--NADP+ reductase [Pseudoalteromonas citrea]|uniref:ferredoxin--NADP(+) reductase n=2 Tax=Pseudoalteromonas citrea TaxID=43655 RepID=A0AAD4ADW8_9GAMM|nr:ferredoxin--NADP reductase [Pseudoalteromonas citrea]KAF7764140.1 ferredoxin--NADP+ reductase [Pseudoalteromonas citrea]